MMWQVGQEMNVGTLWGGGRDGMVGASLSIRAIFHYLHLHRLKQIKTVTTRCKQSYGKPAPGAESHYEFCCSFPHNTHTLHALESSIFIGFLCRLLRSPDLDFVTTKLRFGNRRCPKNSEYLFYFWL